MRSCSRGAAVCSLALSFIAIQARGVTPDSRVSVRLGQQIYFEPNRGQAHPLVRFVGRAPAYDMLMLDGALLFVSHTAQRSLVRLSFERASQPQSVIGLERRGGVSRYDVRGKYVRPT